jgi:molybdate transport system substrate-binding protein
MLTRRAACLGAAGLVLLPRAARAAQVVVATSGGFAAALRALAPDYERASGDAVTLLFGPSMGATHDAVPARLDRGERIDAVVMVGYALDKLVADGRARADSCIDLARSGIGVVVRAGTPRPDISTVGALRRALLDAASVAYSDSASGVYLRDELFPRLGIADAMKTTARMIPAEPVGAVVARGEAELGLQQISELRPIGGIDFAGPLPAAVQRYTVFSAAVLRDAAAPDAARALLRYLAGPQAARAIIESGMEPIGAQ